MSTCEINSFKGEYKWLSNMLICTFRYRGVAWKSVEHFYQAMKTIDVKERESIRCVYSPYEAKKMGKGITIRADFADLKISIMREGIKAKFTQNKALGKLLVDTGDIKIVEGNYWNDTYWGVCRGVGQNNLGILLMELRGELRK